MEVLGKLNQAQMEWITTAQRATVRQARGMMYWDYETQDILVSDGAALVEYKRRGIEGVLGELRESMLTEVQFQAETDSTWVLCDGRSVLGSDYATLTGFTVIPDARGMTLRGKNNGRVDGNQDPDGDRALGTYQADALKAHSHDLPQTRAPGGIVCGTLAVGGGSGDGCGATQPTALSTGANETRAKNIAVNIFIKINRE
jgi:hypothetical protein